MTDHNAVKTALAYIAMRRESVRNHLNPIFIPYYDKLCLALENTYWGPYVGLRDLDEQAKLYAQGRTAQGPIVTNAKPGDSAHNYGCATDWCEMRPEFNGPFMWSKANWAEFGDAVRGCGMRWGGDFKSFQDRPHCELAIAVSWKKVGEIFRASGYNEALEYIKENLDGGSK